MSPGSLLSQVRCDSLLCDSLNNRFWQMFVWLVLVLSVVHKYLYKLHFNIGLVFSYNLLMHGVDLQLVDILVSTVDYSYKPF